MKFKGILTLCFAGFALSAVAQTHVEGAEYYKADQFDNAKELLLRSLNNTGTDKSVSDYYLGMIALREKKNSEAKKYFDEGMQANPEYGYNYVGAGTLALLNGDSKEAERLFKEGESRAKKDPALQIAIARAYNMVDPVANEKQIAKRVEKARKQDIQNPDVYIFEGDQAAEKKDWGDAGAKYEMAANYNANASEAYVKYANLFTMVNPPYAIDMLKKLLSVNPTSALGQRELANAYYNAKDYKNAAEEYGKYVQNPSHFKQDENRYAFLLFYDGDYRKGYDYATSLLNSDPNNFTAQRYQFMNAAQMDSMKDQLLPMAEALYKKHLSNPAENKFAAIDFTLIADEFAKAKRPDEAVAVLEEAIKEMPDNAAFNKDLAMKYVDMNNITKAAEAFRGYVEKVEQQGNVDASQQYNNCNQQATFSFYAAVENKDNPAKAKEFFDEVLEEAIKEMPDNAAFNKDLAMKYVDMNNITKAAEAFRGYVEKVEQQGNVDASQQYNNCNQQATFSFYAAVENKDNPAKAKEFFDEVLANAKKMEELNPDNYKPKMLEGDVAKQTAPSEDAATVAAQPKYEEAVALLEASPNPERYARDAKTLYMYLGNYYIHKDDVAKAKEYYNKFLALDPNNEPVRKYVESLK